MFIAVAEHCHRPICYRAHLRVHHTKQSARVLYLNGIYRWLVRGLRMPENEDWGGRERRRPPSNSYFVSRKGVNVKSTPTCGSSTPLVLSSSLMSVSYSTSGRCPDLCRYITCGRQWYQRLSRWGLWGGCAEEKVWTEIVQPLGSLTFLSLDPGTNILVLIY